MRHVSGHLAENVHAAEAKHQDHLEKTSRKIAAIHRALHKASGLAENTDGPHAQLAAEHEKQADLHKAHADHHREAMAECQKTIASADLEKRNSNSIVPDHVSGVHPGFRMIPRTGQREANQGDKPKVDLALETFVKVEDD